MGIRPLHLWIWPDPDPKNTLIFTQVKKPKTARSFNQTATSSFQDARSFNLPAERISIL